MSEEIMKVEHCYSLRFVKEAKALTEGADQLDSFIKQRRRWINGSWFAMIKVIMNWRLLGQVCCQSKRKNQLKLLFAFQRLYLLVIMAMTWFSPGTYFLSYYLVVKLVLCEDSSDLDTDNYSISVCSMLIRVYVFLLSCSVLAALATCPGNLKAFLVVLCWFFSFTGVLIVFGSVYLIDQTELVLADWMTYEAFAIFFVIAIAILCYWESFFTILLFSMHYLLLTPTYINILTVFAMCRTDDVSWGTRGKELKGKSLHDDFSYKKTLCLLIFLASNVVLGCIGM
jgi:chitin synthase